VVFISVWPAAEAGAVKTTFAPLLPADPQAPPVPQPGLRQPELQTQMHATVMVAK